MKLIEFRDVSLGYGRRTVLDGLNLGIGNGERIGILGPNGSGKTTFLRGIMGLLTPLKGKIVRERHVSFGYVKQEHSIDTLFPFTAFEVVCMGLEPLNPFTKNKKELKAKVEKAMDFTDILKCRDQLFNTLSGGQKQRVLIARALVNSPEILVMDEPVSDLDEEGVHEIITLLNSIHREKNMTILIVSHLVSLVLKNVDKVLLLNNANLEFIKPEEAIYPKSDNYGRDQCGY